MTPESSPPRAAGSVQSLVRGLDILLYVAESAEPVTASVLASELSLPRPTVYRLLETLVARGLVARQDRTLVPTPRLLMLGTGRTALSMESVARPHLQSLVETVGETVGLHVRVGDHRRCVDEIEGLHGIRWARGVGFTAPVWSGAVGHIMLAGLAETALEELYGRIDLTPLSSNSTRDLTALRARVDAARRQGWSASRSETVEGAAAVAAPIYNQDATVAVMSLYAPADRFEGLLAHVEDLREAAANASRDWMAVAPSRGVGNRGGEQRAPSVPAGE